MQTSNTSTAKDVQHTQTTVPARDGANTSLWQGTVSAFTASNHIQSTKLYDVIIAGGGITGLTTGLVLQSRGLKCLLLEAATIGYGTTGGTTAHINTLLDVPYNTIGSNFTEEASRQVFEAVSGAIQRIRENISSYNIQCGFKEVNAYLYAQNEKQEKELDDILNASVKAGVRMSYVNEIPVNATFTKAAKALGQARFHPLRYLHGLLRAFIAGGGAVLEHTRVNAVEQNNSIDVTTDAGSFQSSHFIYATHIPPGVNWLHMNCLPYRSYAMAVTLKNDDYPDDLSYDMYDPYHYYRTQVIDDQPYLIVGGKDHKTGEDTHTQNHMRELEAHIRSLYDIDEVAFNWSSQFYESADGLPYIGQLPGKPGNIYVATGFGGNGMVYSSVAAHTLADLVTGKDAPNIDLFNPNRIKPIAGFSNFLQHNAAVVKQYLGKLLPTTGLKELAALARGEARIVKYEGQNVAVYRDENNVLHAVNPTCTHMQCTVKWNQTERSWDCPCHGARFSVDGTVLNGPAHTDLEKIELG